MRRNCCEGCPGYLCMTNCKEMDDSKKNRMTEMSDAEFLSFLYSERDREESLTTYQGWNIWALYGGMITVICTGYNILCAHHHEMDWLRTGYFLSGIISFAFCYRYVALFVSMLWGRKRGVDVRKVRYLKDVAPIPSLIVTVLCSAGFAIFFPLVNVENRWGLISILWIWMTVAYIVICFNVYIGKDNIVQSSFDGITFSIVKLEKWVYTIISLIFSIIWLRSFRYLSGPLIGSPDVEIAICIASLVLLLYLLIKIKISIKKSSRIDVLLDDYIYKERNQESVFMQLQSNRMGYGVIEVCFHEVHAIKKSFDDFEPQKKKVEELTEMFKSRSFEFERLPDYYEVLKESSRYIKYSARQAKALHYKLSQIEKNVPILLIKDDCEMLMTIVGVQLKRAFEMSEIVNTAIRALQKCLGEYGCNKYGGWCAKDCSHRHDRKTLAYRIELWRMKFFARHGSMLRKSKACEHNKDEDQGKVL